MKNIDEVREMFSHDRFATVNGAQIDEIGEHYAVCSLSICDNHKNAMGNVMGGVSFTLADFAFAVASNWQGQPTVSLNSSITYLGKVKGDKLFAKAVCVKDGRTTCYYEVTVKDNLGNIIVAVTTTGFHVG